MYCHRYFALQFNPLQPGANDMRSALYTLLDKHFDRVANAFGFVILSLLALHAIALLAYIALGLTLR
jgi:hypothetical protein